MAQSNHLRVVFKKSKLVADGSWVSEEQDKLIQGMVQFYVKRWNLDNPKSRLKNLTISLEVGKQHNVFGLWKMTGNNFQSGRLSLYVNNIADSFLHLMTTIAHEFVHVKQWAFGELQWVTLRAESAEVSCYSWGGGFYGEVDTKEYEKYRNLPWEVEAHTLQDGLVSEYLVSQF